MRTRNTAFIFGVLLLSGSFALGGCGGTSYRSSVKGTNMVVPGDAGSIPVVENDSATDTSGTTDSTPTVTTGVPPYTYPIQGIGYTSVKVSVQANRILKVQFMPGTQDRSVEGTNFSPPYAQLGVYVKVGSQSQATEMLSNGLLGGSPQKSRILEFSNSFSRTCDRLDTSCRQEVTITIERPNYDYFCLIGYAPGCPWAQVWSTHPWNGTLLIQTDDTDALSMN